MKAFQYITTLLIAVISFVPTQISNGCGYYEGDYYVYTLIEPNLMDEPSYRPFFFTFQTYFNDWEGQKFAKEENLKEWGSYFKNKGTVADLEYLIYKMPIGEAEAIRDKNKPALSNKAQDNGIAQQLMKNGDDEFINYLIYAKSCEPYATQRDYIWDGEIDEKSKKAHDDLIEEGLTAFYSCESDFMKLRYAFQIVRLARYAFDWDETIKWYEDLVPSLSQVNSIMKYWAMEHYAGALYNKGEYEKSAYYFSKVFDKSPSRRFSAHKSFAIKSDEQWKATLALCKNNDERATLYAMRAIKPYSNAVEEMQDIYRLSPQNKNLELLLIREIQKLEYEMLGSSYNSEKEHNKVSNYDYETDESSLVFPRKESQRYLEQLLSFAEKCADQRQVERPHVWRLAMGYLHFINGNTKSAMEVYDFLERKNVGSEHFKHQVKVFKAAATIERLTKVDAKTEALAMEYLPILKSVRPTFSYASGVAEQANFLLDKLAYLYQQQGEMGKAYLCHKNGLYQLFIHPDLMVVNDLIKLYDRKDKLNDFEKMLVQPVFYKSEWIEGEMRYTEENKDIRNQLLEVKGTILLAVNQLEDAIEVFKQLPDSYKKRSGNVSVDWEFPSQNEDRFMLSNSDPFFLYTYRKHPHRPAPSLNKLGVAQKLYELEKLSKTDDENAAEHYFKLGNAHFEMSYHGNSWRAKEYYWTVSGYEEISENVYDFYTGFHGRGNQSFRYNDDALEYLQKVMDLENENNKEWVAKACFVAAACQSRKAENLKEKYFKKLKNEYADTEFYQQAIRECFYFSDFVSKN